jgi:competence protein ComEA
MRARRLHMPTVIFGLFPVLYAAETPPNEVADKVVYQTVCGNCHAYDMVSDIRSTPEWEQTIDAMIGFGATITDAQLEAVRRHLLRTMVKVNVNTAKAAELPLVLNISEATAQALVKYRTAHGDFKTLDDLKKVPGVDAAKLDARKDRVAF